MNDNISHLWSSHANLVARHRERKRFNTFSCCAAILICAGFVALVMLIRGGVLA